MMSAIVIVNYCTPDMAIAAVESVLVQLAPSDKIYLVDGGSPDRSPEILTRQFAASSQIELLLMDVNGGFAYANNAAIRCILASEKRYEYIWLLNPDTIAQVGAMETLVSFLEQRGEIGIAGSRLENPDGTSQCAARRFPGVLSEFESSACTGPISRLLSRWIVSPPETESAHACDWLPGASLCVRREVFESIGLLDEEYFMYFEEVDFCLRAKRAGWQVWYVPESRVVHLVGQSSGVTSISGEVKRLPKYWFDSRHRYFKKNFGMSALLLANLACTFGLVFNKVRNVIQRSRGPHAPKMLSDLMVYELQSWRR